MTLEEKENTSKLFEYSELESSSESDYCSGLISIRYVVHYGTDDFQAAYAKEVEHWLNYYKNNFNVVEKEETVTHKVKHLKWK